MHLTISDPSLKGDVIESNPNIIYITLLTQHRAVKLSFLPQGESILEWRTGLVLEHEDQGRSPIKREGVQHLWEMHQPPLHRQV